MKKYCKFLLFSSAVLLTSYAQSAEINERDIETLREWINSRRMITVKELGGQLSISGDIHAEMQAANEQKGGIRQRGSGTPNPLKTYDIEFNLAIDYRADRNWAAARLRFDDNAGITNKKIGSGETNNIKLDRAYFGYRIFDGNQHTMDIEMGRRSLSSVFDSKLEFNSNFDGALFKDNYVFDHVGDFYYQLGLLLVNEKRSQVAYIGEIGLQNIARTGFYSKYSLTDWDTTNASGIPHQFQFVVSQLLLGYKFIPTQLDRIINFYLAGLYNHVAQKHEISADKKANAGGYIGMSIGQSKMKGDWTFEANYQFLQAQCVPDFDSSGVGLGNSSGNGFYYEKIKDTETPVLNTRSTAEGNVNFRGFELTLQYLLTNNLNLFQQWKQGITLDDRIGPFRKYKQYEVDFIFLF
jgi:hypothetical protein